MLLPRLLRHLGVVFAFSSTLVLADEASHRQAASEILEAAGGKQLLTAGFDAMAGTIETMWKQQGVPEDMFPVLRGALRAWVENDLKWEELEPRMVDLYVREFTESELREMAAFYKTPTGRKALSKLSILMADGAKIGEAYATSKEAQLTKRVEEAIAQTQTQNK